MGSGIYQLFPQQYFLSLYLQEHVSIQRRKHIYRIIKYTVHIYLTLNFSLVMFIKQSVTCQFLSSA